ncbi:MAG: hypothetical protein A2583_05235 [Bdellovibrionales bacterium RIFOXYD1_FULL_53_11]|nr:MAG: hypothetical protein A2583_05235 [Bdellovibrionales bacterium RIFOXYD1_FULL_53_11]
MPSDRIQAVKKWWGNHVNEHPAWRTEELPDKWFKDILLSLGLAHEIRRDAIVLGKPGAELPVLIRSHFWEIVSCILKPYAPYSINGITAIKFHLGDKSIPYEISIITKSSSTRIDIHGISTLILEKQPAFFKNTDTVRNGPAIESPESLLVHLRPLHLRDHPQIISAFLKAVDFDHELLRTLLLQKSRPIVFRRLATLFKQVGKHAEAKLVLGAVRITTSYSPPGKSQILKYSLPESVAKSRRMSDPVHEIRFRDQLRIYRDRALDCMKKIKIPEWNLKKILSHAEQTKKYDTYHSSTIEGYAVTREEIQLLMEGRETSTTGANHEEIHRKMALKGYLDAHKFVLQLVSDNFRSDTPLTESTIREIYAHLFSPSLDAGLIRRDQLTSYRNTAVYIRNSRHVPPNHEKVGDLMRCLVEEANGIENSMVRALLTHYGFVTIHPYPDGNGRAARFLMNHVLCTSGIPWITIRIDDREKYFKALETAQCDEDIIPLAELLKQYLEESR